MVYGYSLNYLRLRLELGKSRTNQGVNCNRLGYVPPFMLLTLELLLQYCCHQDL